MSRKDYVAMAEVVRDGCQSYAPYLADKLADVFASDNPRFDRGRFLVACGMVA